MKLTYIITINSIISLEYLTALITSLNLQTCQNFDVIFYNQTKHSEAEIFERLHVKCHFKYRFFAIEDRFFLGRYPIWDFYDFHQFLLKNDFVADYFMSLHMEEFLEPHYTSSALDVLSKTGLDILMGNLHQTQYSYEDVKLLSSITSDRDFRAFLKDKEMNKSPKWSLPSKPFFLGKSPRTILGNIMKYKELGWRQQLHTTRTGYTRLKRYILEDVFFMSKEFATKYRWYESMTNLYFEDIHINFSLEPVLKTILQFPVYLNNAKVYHLKHDKFYYQIADEEFATKMLQFQTNNPVLNTLKEAITLYRANKHISIKNALRTSRRNASGKGSADLNYSFHLDNIKTARRHCQ